MTLAAQTAHTYREGHILVHATLQETQHNLLGLLPRDYVYRRIALVVCADALYQFRAVNKWFYGQNNH